MKVFFAMTYDTGDGMEPQLFLAQSLKRIKELACFELDPNLGTQRLYHCEGCDDEVDVERPDADWSDPAICTDCNTEMEVVEDDDIQSSVEQVEKWDGKGSLEVFYFDGNPGKMLLGSTTMHS